MEHLSGKGFAPQKTSRKDISTAYYDISAPQKETSAPRPPFCRASSMTKKAGIREVMGKNGTDVPRFPKEIQ